MTARVTPRSWEQDAEETRALDLDATPDLAQGGAPTNAAALLTDLANGVEHTQGIVLGPLISGNTIRVLVGNLVTNHAYRLKVLFDDTAQASVRKAMVLDITCTT